MWLHPCCGLSSGHVVNKPEHPEEMVRPCFQGAKYVKLLENIYIMLIDNSLLFLTIVNKYLHYCLNKYNIDIAEKFTNDIVTSCFGEGGCTIPCP